MMLWLLLESALRSLALGGAVWLGLKALRVRNPLLELTAWTMVLVAALTMPLLLQAATVTIPVRLPVPISIAYNRRPSPPAPIEASMGPAPSLAPQPQAATTLPIDWQAIATGVYLLLTGALLFRLGVGVAMLWRLARAAQPIREGWTEGSDVRVSGAIGMPVTFGSIILLPPECRRWPTVKRQAVLSHERSHVARADYVVLLLAALHRALFWFNPLSWWLLGRIAALTEAASDDAAIAEMRDRLSYVEVLLDIAKNAGRAPAGVAMARPTTVARRVSRILREATLPTRLGWRKRIPVAASLLPAVVIAAGTIAQTAPAGDKAVTVDLTVPGVINFVTISLEPLSSVSAQFQLLPVFLSVPIDHLAIRSLTLRTAQLTTLADMQLPSSALAPNAGSAGVSQPTDMNGTWSIFGWAPPGRESISDVGPPLRPHYCTFRQSGNKLNGTCKNNFLETGATGSVDGRNVHWDWFYWLGSHRLENPGIQLRRASFDGVMGSDNILRGTYKTTYAYRPELRHIPPGTFRAEKQTPDPS